MFKNEIPHTPIHNTPPRFIEVAGSHHQMGRQIGEAARHQLQHSVENARKLLEASFSSIQLTWEQAKIHSKKYLPFAEETYPHYVDEMRGIAEGANLNFDDVLVVNCMEEIAGDTLHLTHCTSMAVNNERSSNGHVLAAHNEDWYPDDEDDVLIISAKPNQEPPFLSMTYGALLCNVGFNAYGITQLIDSVYPSDIRFGLPRLLVSRAVLASQRITDAFARILVANRAAGYNHLIVHESGEIYSVEVSSKKFEVLYARDGSMIHTNHYLDPQMKLIERNPEHLLSSRARYFRALRLLGQTEKHSIESLQAIQQDHVNAPKSICNHDVIGEPIDRHKTICSLVIDLTEREMHVAWGNPCQNQYYTFKLNA
jgi:isopenicillin-N N-acyltransferase-like protein